MIATDPSTTPPSKWYESPTFKYLAGIVLSVALALLASKFGIAPAAVPGVPQASTPSVLVLNVSPTPAAPAGPIAVTGK